ncbi:hypothetical protein GCM10007906_33820 [Vibrio hyugaensis]|uniref:Uncharacterized protein n=1 Tax=Vibrio hyugaensis TaxID=1534743 RepID=A0ABQ5Y6X5_9VIBR|nr:hypothetical protein GCM10007906_33820 [Vibrio hyugaensis]
MGEKYDSLGIPTTISKKIALKEYNMAEPPTGPKLSVTNLAMPSKQLQERMAIQP